MVVTFDMKYTPVALIMCMFRPVYGNAYIFKKGIRRTERKSTDEALEDETTIWRLLSESRADY